MYKRKTDELTISVPCDKLKLSGDSKIIFIAAKIICLGGIFTTQRLSRQDCEQTESNITAYGCVRCMCGMEYFHSGWFS
jgi:hypothetical protein